jgi:hypothetical protein
MNPGSKTSNVYLVVSIATLVSGQLILIIANKQNLINQPDQQHALEVQYQARISTNLVSTLSSGTTVGVFGLVDKNYNL